MPAPFIRIDGEAAEGLAASLATDRGFALGDGVFRTMRVTDGRIVAWRLHREKLLSDASRIGLEASPSAIERLEKDLADLASIHPHAIARVTLTAGGGPRGYARVAAGSLRLVLRGDALVADAPDPGLPATVRICALRLALQPRLAGIKHLNRLEQVLARAEWDDPGIDEGLMLDAQGSLVCGTMSNLFLQREGRWITPKLDRCGVSGVQRQRILEWAKACGVSIEETRIPGAWLHEPMGLLISNSVIGVRWVGSVDGRATTGRPAVYEPIREWLERE